jgi:hypothetical protein
MIRNLIAAFNHVRERFVILGVDECMSAWRAISGDFIANGIPHLVKIARKPEGVGAEFKSLADSHSGIIMHLEIQEGKIPMLAKEYCAAYGAGTACTLRMTKHWQSNHLLEANPKLHWHHHLSCQ